ncbi:MAG: prolipoprotein diacylglyceryl transferase [Gemmatimonadetes bacterium]|nr:MAG: prolipoprotein diacylglyceryl transferase [Gemmatimonadota bacterium]
MTLPYPKIPPDIISFGPFKLRWYGVMYLVGYFVGYRLALSRIRRGASVLTQQQLDTLVAYLVVGMLIGARLIYVFVYDFPEFRAHPWRAFAIWTGGLSFHGAIVGMACAIALFAHRHRVPTLAITDIVAFCGAPGLFFGRIGNFINGELYGRPSNVPWAMIFPTDPLRVPRHPSQLYEALAEGVVLFLVLWLLDRRARARGWYWDGLLTGAFLVGYALLRFLLEFTRQPDAQLGFIVFGKFSMGQLLSTIMLLVGIVVLATSRYRGSKNVPTTASQ